jgi:TRAP-type mannitol/chloroaromatic compound transport system substrate-binding protein
MYAEFNANNGAALTRLIDEHGVQLREFSDEVFNAIAEAGSDVVASTASEGGITKEVYDSYAAFRDDVTGWTTLADTAYTNARAKAEGRS